MQRMTRTLACLAACLATTGAQAVVTGNWTVDGNGNWNTPANWSSNPSTPNGIGDTANLNNSIGANRIVTLDVPVTLGTLLLQDSTSTYFSWILSGTNALTLDAASGNALVTVAQGTANSIDTSIVLNDPLTLVVNQGTAVVLNGNISGAFNVYHGTGQNTFGERGALTLNGNNSFADFYSSYDPNTSYGPLRIGSDTALGAGTVHLRGVRVEPYGATRSLSNAVSIEADLIMVASSYGLGFGGAATLTGNRVITVNNDMLSLTAGLGQNAAGRTLTKAGTGFLVIGGTSSYSGTTTLSAGVLRASDGAGLPTTSLLQIRGGVLEMSGAFSRPLGTAAGNVNWDTTSSGGFSASGGPATVNLNGGGADNLAWGSTASFIGTGAVLNFGSTKSDNVLTFVDNIDLGAGATTVREINVADNPSSAADKTVLSGALSGTGILRKTGTGVLELSGANSFGGTVEVVLGQLAIASSGALASASQLTVTGGSGLLAYGDVAAHTDQSLQALAVPNGEAVVTVVPGAGFGTRLTFSSLTRTTPGTLLFRGSGLGSAAYPAAGVGNTVFTDVAGLVLVGAGGGAGSTTVSICPFARGDTDTSGNGADFVTYQAGTGVRTLSSGAGEYTTVITAGQTQLDNARLAAAATVNGTATINALVLASGGSLAGTSALTVNSGAVLALAGNSGISKPLAFGAREGVIHAAGAATTVTISGAISGSAGLTKAGLGTLTLSSTAHTFGGAVTVSAGILDLGSGAVLSNLYPPVDVYVAQGAALRFPNNLYIGALDGTGTIIGTTGNNIFRFGCDNSDSTFGGSFTQAGGGPPSPGFDKLGKGTATIVAPLGTLGSSVAVTDGTLRFYNAGSSPVGTTIYGGATLLFDDTGTHVDNRTSNVTLGGEYKVLGNLAANTAAGGPANTTFFFGSATVLGNPILTLVPGAGFEAQYRQRNGGDNNTCQVGASATAFVRGDGLAQASGTRSRFTIQSMNFNTLLIGGAGQVMSDDVANGKANTPQVSVIYRMYGDSASSGLGSGFVTYDRGSDHAQNDTDPGVRLLAAGEYAGTIADGAGAVLSTIANTKLTSAVAGINSATRVNTLLLGENGSVAGSGTLTVESGLIMSTGSNGGIATTGLTTGTGGAVRLITPEASDLLTISSAVSTTSGLIKSGEGTAVLTGTNGYSGATCLANGALRATDGTSLPAGSTVTFTGGVLESSGTFSRTLGVAGTNVRWDEYCSGGFAANGGAFNIQLNGGTAAVTWNAVNFVQGQRSLILGSATADNVVDFQNGLSLGTLGFATGDRTESTSRTILVIDNPGSTGDYGRVSGVIAGTDANVALRKDGTGMLSLSNTNTYVGGTVVAAGTLAVNNNPLTGSGTGTGSVSVLSGGTLGGTGKVAGLITAAGGTVSPGNSIGTLTAGGGVTFGDNGRLLIELSSVGSGDQLSVGGNIDLTSALDRLDVVTTDGGTLGSYDILTWTGTLTGQFDQVFYNGVPMPNPTVVGGINGNLWIEYRGSTLTFVPEPGMLALALLGAAAGLARRRWA